MATEIGQILSNISAALAGLSINGQTWLSLRLRVTGGRPLAGRGSQAHSASGTGRQSGFRRSNCTSTSAQILHRLNPNSSHKLKFITQGYRRLDFAFQIHGSLTSFRLYLYCLADQISSMTSGEDSNAMARLLKSVLLVETRLEGAVHRRLDFALEID